MSTIFYKKIEAQFYFQNSPYLLEIPNNSEFDKNKDNFNYTQIW